MVVGRGNGSCLLATASLVPLIVGTQAWKEGSSQGLCQGAVQAPSSLALPTQAASPQHTQKTAPNGRFHGEDTAGPEESRAGRPRLPSLGVSCLLSLLQFTLV